MKCLEFFFQLFVIKLAFPDDVVQSLDFEYMLALVCFKFSLKLFPYLRVPLFKLIALGIDLDCVHLYLLIIHFIIFLLFNLTLAEFISSLHADALLHLHHVLL